MIRATCHKSHHNVANVEVDGKSVACVHARIDVRVGQQPSVTLELAESADFEVETADAQMFITRNGKRYRLEDVERPRTLNLNHNVLVRMLPAGLELWRKSYTSIGLAPPPLNVDENGYTSMQLHQMAHIFGPGFGGFHCPIETTIVIPPGTLKESIWV